MRKSYRGKIKKPEEEDSPEALSREARRDAKKSIANRTGPPQVDVIKKFSAAATLYEQQGEINDAREILMEAQRYLIDQGGGSGDPELRERINRKLNSLRTGYSGIQLAYSILAIVSFLGALLFISFDLTGHVVMGQARTNLSFVAAGLFVLGLVFVGFYFKNKK